MREIKFRVWNIDEYISLNKAVHDDIVVIQQPSSLDDSLIDVNWEGVELEQFTGMLDKHGMPIFEGDIINWHGFNLEVKFIVDGWFAETADESITEPGQEWESSCSVIGNIHQHAHLLEQNKC
jgi:hypothetical protein